MGTRQRELSPSLPQTTDLGVLWPCCLLEWLCRLSTCQRAGLKCWVQEQKSHPAALIISNKAQDDSFIPAQAPPAATEGSPETFICPLPRTPQPCATTLC